MSDESKILSMDSPTKVQVFFTVGSRHETALFNSNTPTEQIKDLFLGAAETGPWDVIKLKTINGEIYNIDTEIPSNGPKYSYDLQVIATGLGMFQEELSNEIKTLETRIANLERRINSDLPLPPSVQQLKSQVDVFREKLETTESLSWLGFYKQLPEPLSSEECRRLRYRRKSDTLKQKVRQNFLNICDSEISDSVKHWLRMPTFDSRQWEDEELILFLQQMYMDYDLCSKFAISINTLRNFLFEAYKNYNEVPFHNFRHCFCVTQMMYAISWCVDLSSKLGDLEILILLTSCICHDLDHPGFNNIYQINARTELAIRYNDISPLENHHCSVAFRILENDDCNIFKSFSSESFKQIREGIIRCILATDMARHNEILSNFKEIIPEFDYSNKGHVNLLCMVLIKVSDISNEARPMDVAELWLDKLLQEFFKQSDAEKLEGLPVTPFMDRERITKPSSQCSFIGLVLLPLFEALGDLLNELQELIIEPVRSALDYYRRLNEASKEERMHRKSIVSEMGDQGSIHSSTGTHVAKSGSSTSLRRSAHTSSRSHSDEDLDREEIIDEELSTLEDVLEDLENEKEAVTEVEVSEKALIFKISTEGGISSHRKSCPSSRKGSRERGQHFSSTDLARAMQRGKLKTGALSFDQHCLMRSKLSFDAPEFLDEYAIVRNNKSEPCTYEDEKYERLLSKETINLNKRNSIKTPIKESGIENLHINDVIINSSGNREMPSSSNDDISNVDELTTNKNDTTTTNNLLLNKQLSTNNSNDNLNNISVEHVSVKQEDYESNNENKNTCSIFSRIKKITEQFSFSAEKEKKYKNIRINLRNTNILTSPCCRSLENIDDNKLKTTTVTTNKMSGSFKGWFFLNKDNKDTEGWSSSSDADVYRLSSSTNRNDNHSSLPSTSKSENNCFKTTGIDSTTERSNKSVTPNFQIIQLNEPSKNNCST